MSSSTSAVRSSPSSAAFAFPSQPPATESCDQGPPEQAKPAEIGGAWEQFVGDAHLSRSCLVGLEVKTSSSISPAQRHIQLAEECVKQLCAGAPSLNNKFFANGVLLRLTEDEILYCMDKLYVLLSSFDPLTADADVFERIRLFKAISEISLLNDPDDCIEKTRRIVLHDRTGYTSAKNMDGLVKRFADMHPQSRQRSFEYLMSYIGASDQQLAPSDIERHFDRSLQLVEQGGCLDLTQEEHFFARQLMRVGWDSKQKGAFYAEIAKLPPLERVGIMRQAALLCGPPFFVSDTIAALQTLHAVKQDVRDHCMACLEKINSPHWLQEERVKLFHCMVQWQGFDLEACIKELSTIMKNARIVLWKGEDALSILEEISSIRTDLEASALGRVQCLRDLKSIIDRPYFYCAAKEVVKIFKTLCSIESEACRLICVPSQDRPGNEVVVSLDHKGAHLRMLLFAMELGGVGADWSAEKINKFLCSIDDHSEAVLDQEGSDLLRRLYKVEGWAARDTVQLFTEAVSHIDSGELFWRIRRLLKEFDEIVASAAQGKEDLIKKLGARLTDR